jgi:hypothetical protein
MSIDDRIASELRRHAPEVDEQVAWDRIRSTVPARRRSRAIRLVAVPVAALGFVVLGYILLPTFLSRPDVAGDPPSPLLGTWVSIDQDLSTPTMVIEVSTEGVVEMVVVDEDLDDDFASVCSGSSSTMTGTGRFEGDNVLVFPTPVLTCDDGTQPEALGGPPLEEQLRNMTFTHRPDSDTLIDNSGERWTREGVEATLHPMIRWPQASVEEVRDAQQLADAGDPNFTWQLEPNMESMDPGQVPELLSRAVWKRFGWEESALIGYSGEMESEGIRALGFQLVRCEPGQSNPLWSDDPVLGGCASTIDDSHYETVEIFVAQPGRQGPDGIWVVSSWPSETWSLEAGLIQYEGEQNAENGVPVPAERSDTSPDRTAPPSEAEITELLNGFVEARVNGAGAQQYLYDDSEEDIPLLYATSSGDRYERAEFEQVLGIDWPYGQIAFMIRLFAGDTVVEQLFFMPHDDPIQFAPDGRLGLNYAPDGYATAIAPTSEDGQPVALSQSLFDGEVILQVAHPWIFGNYPIGFFGRLIPDGNVGPTTDAGERQDWDEFWVVADPLVNGTGCQTASPVDAEALAESIRSYPGLEGTAPVAVSAGGAEALMMDVVLAAGATIRVAVDEQYNPCANELLNPMLDRGVGSSMTVVKEGVMQGQATGERMRLYLIDMPEESSMRTIAIAIAAPESRFERAVEAAAPVVESIEFHPR